MEEAIRRKLETRVARLEQQIRSFKELHASELGLILDELASLRSDLAAMAAPPAAGAPASSAEDQPPRWTRPRIRQSARPGAPRSSAKKKNGALRIHGASSCAAGMRKRRVSGRRRERGGA